MFPTADMFLPSSKKSVQLFNHWLLLRQTMVWRANRVEPPAQPLSTKVWREVLYWGVSYSGALDMPSGVEKKVNGWLKRSQLRVSSAGFLKTTTGDSLQLTIPPISNPPTVNWRHVPLELTTEFPAGTVVSEVLWELCELNFRFDLLALDNILFSEHEQGPEERWQHQLQLFRCFRGGTEPSFSLTRIAIPSSNSGLVSDSVLDRHPFVRALAKLMMEWRIPVPRTMSSLLDRATSKSAMIEFEQSVIHFFCHTFVAKMYRNPTLPRRLFTSST